ncbi:MAG: diguanylate cyclase [Gammaproteobacteria bacterium]|nr:diguanylate cyclase [Gammaproteobacteria bacterium]
MSTSLRHATVDKLIQAADTTLYQAKHDGRNRIYLNEAAGKPVSQEQTRP